MPTDDADSTTMPTSCPRPTRAGEPPAPAHRTMEIGATVRDLVTVSWPDGPVLLAVSTPAGIQLRDPESGTVVAATPPRHNHDGFRLAWIAPSRGRAYLVSGGVDGIRRWDPRTLMRIGGPLLPAAAPDLVHLTAVPVRDGRILLAVAADTRTIRLLDPVTRGQVHPYLYRHDQAIRAMAVVPLSATRSLLATTARGDGVQLWDPETGVRHRPKRTLPTGAVHALAATPLSDGRPGLAVGTGRDIRLWDPGTDTQHGQPIPLSGMNLCALPLPGGRNILAIDSAAGLRLWDLAAHGPISAPAPFAAPMMTAVPMPDGHTVLATADHDDTVVRLWNPAP